MELEEIKVDVGQSPHVTSEQTDSFYSVASMMDKPEETKGPGCIRNNNNNQFAVDQQEINRLKIEPSTIELREVIGEGAFGEVREAYWLGTKIAVKLIKTKNPHVLQQEVNILSQLQHPNIVQLLGVSLSGEVSMILMELMDSDLRHLMDTRIQRPPLTYKEAIDIISQIAAGMAYLHYRQVFHGDLKAANVLVSSTGNHRIQVKIADFGVSQQVKLDKSDTQNFAGKKIFAGIRGTRGWQAPEVSSSEYYEYGVSTSNYRDPYSALEHLFIRPTHQAPEDFNSIVYNNELNYSAKADVYSFAVTCAEILTGEVPFSHMKKRDIPRAVIKGARPHLPSDIDSQLAALIHRCWHHKPSNRPEFVDICSTLRTLDLTQDRKRCCTIL
jgi:serine/threonine protein kinase